MRLNNHLKKIDQVYQNLLLYQKIRRLYKNPKKGLNIEIRKNPKNDDMLYDVGGALLHFLGKEQKKPEYFPVPPEILDTLKELNPDLPVEKARHYSIMIVHLNDSGKFEEAWNNVKMALTSGETEK